MSELTVMPLFKVRSLEELLVTAMDVGAVSLLANLSDDRIWLLGKEDEPLGAVVVGAHPVHGFKKIFKLLFDGEAVFDGALAHALTKYGFETVYSEDNAGFVLNKDVVYFHFHSDGTVRVHMNNGHEKYELEVNCGMLDVDAVAADGKQLAERDESADS